MTLEQLDSLRGYAIAIIIIAVSAIGASTFIPITKVQRIARAAAGLTGGLAGLLVFFLFTFISGWDEYFAEKSGGHVVPEYSGRHQMAARVIRTLGEMDVSGIGLVFGGVGLVLLAVAYVQVRNLRKP